MNTLLGKTYTWSDLISKEEAEEVKKKFEEVGATVEIK